MGHQPTLKDIVWKEMTQYLTGLLEYYKSLNIDYNSLYFIQRTQLEIELEGLIDYVLPRVQELMLEVDTAEHHGDQTERRSERQGDRELQQALSE